jgi:hypothetical protein
LARAAGGEAPHPNAVFLSNLHTQLDVKCLLCRQEIVRTHSTSLATSFLSIHGFAMMSLEYESQKIVRTHSTSLATSFLSIQAFAMIFLEYESLEPGELRLVILPANATSASSDPFRLKMMHVPCELDGRRRPNAAILRCGTVHLGRLRVAR